MYLGNSELIGQEDGKGAGGGNNLFILDGQNDEVLGHINKKHVIFNEHEQDLPTYRDTFQFTVFGDKRYAEHLGKRNGIIAPGEDGELLEFRIFESIKYRDSEGLKVEAFSLATYLDLKTEKIFDPGKTNPETAQRHAELALQGTEWQVGTIDYAGIRTLEFDSPYNPYEYLKRIAREFELELRFYVETDGQKVTGRYVDLVERIGDFRGRTVEFGRDLQRIERRENTNDIVTALWVYGPEREDGTRLKVFVEDNEAKERWGRKGKHIIDYYEPQTENENITEERLTTLGNMELNKRINAVVSYQADIVDLENVPGMENKKVRFGDTIRIKDLKFSPPLYLEARIYNQKRDVFNKANKRVELGDYIEYTEDEVQAIWRQLQQQIQKKISTVQAEQMIEEYAEPKKVESPTPPPIEEGENPIWIDTSKEPNVAHVVVDDEWNKITPTEANEVGAETPQGAQEKADTAEQNAKSYTDIIKGDLEDGIQQAMASADGKNTVFRQSSTPPTTNRKIGDLWFKTNEGNKMYVWTGSWTETKLDYQALSVGRLSAISADLGNITAGDITGVNITGATITQQGEGSSIVFNDEGITQYISGAIGVQISTEYWDWSPFSPAMVKFFPESDQNHFAVAASAPGLGDGFIGFVEQADPNLAERVLNIRNLGGAIAISADEFSVGGNAIISSNGEVLELQGVTTSYLGFYTDGTRRGYIGFGSPSSYDYFVRNEASGDLRLHADSGQVVIQSSTQNVLAGHTRFQRTRTATNRWNFNYTNDGFEISPSGSGWNNYGTLYLNRSGAMTRVLGDFAVDGSKSAIVQTDNFGERLMYAVEAPESRFMDVIEEILEEGEHWIGINHIFAETINDYSVIPFAEGGGSIKVIEKEDKRFKVEVTGDGFARCHFIIYGRRKGYEHEYMKKIGVETE